MTSLKATFYAFLAAAFYAINIPFSKVLLSHIENTILAGLLYIGAGMGIGMIFLFNKRDRQDLLKKDDLPYTLAMIVLDIIAPILLMGGLKSVNASTAALLNNFEIVATSLIALLIFKEAISKYLWVAIFLVVMASGLLTTDDISSLSFSWGSILILLAASCWGLENNCTRKIADRNTSEIVILKGIFSGLGSLIVGFFIGEHLPNVLYLILALILGFVAYGLSIYLYVKAQSVIGAAKTSAYYAFAPFIGSALSFIFLKEKLSHNYFLALLVMIIGTSIVIYDTLRSREP